MNRYVKGAILASSVAALAFTVACGPGTDTGTQEVKCKGINTCKGEGACEGEGHSCQGKNECKGQGWVKATKKECKDKGGTEV